MSALVPAQEMPAHPGGSPIVDGAEMEEEPPSGTEVRHRQLAAVPDDGMVSGVADAGARGLRWKGHHDRPVKRRPVLLPVLRQAAIVVVVGEAPRAVEVDPALADELRSRVRCSI